MLTLLTGGARSDKSTIAVDAAAARDKPVTVIATASVLARHLGATLTVVDVAVGGPTGNIRISDALSADRFDVAAQAGISAVEACDADLLVVGEMGIGNTTPAAAVAASVVGGSPVDWVGPGTGIGEEALLHKVQGVQDALDRVGPLHPLEALRRLGGTELVAIASVLEA